MMSIKKNGLKACKIAHFFVAEPGKPWQGQILRKKGNKGQQAGQP